MLVTESRVPALTRRGPLWGLAAPVGIKVAMEQGPLFIYLSFDSEVNRNVAVLHWQLTSENKIGDPTGKSA